MKKIVVATLITTSLVGVSGIAVAKHHKHGHGCDKHKPRVGAMHKMKIDKDALEELKLTDAQKKELDAIYSQFEPHVEPHNQKRIDLLDKKQDLIQSDAFDAEEFEALLIEEDKLHNERQLKRAQLHHEAWKMLTPQQQAQLKKRMEKKQKRFMQKI